ncbi:MAG: DPP IV N-terminal domain-containing protein [Bacteroidales bacterium]
MKKLVSSLIVMLFVSFAWQGSAQEKVLTLIDAFRPGAYPEHLSNTEWRPDSREFTWKSEDKIVSIQASNEAKKKTLADLKALNKALKDASYETLDNLPGFHWVDQKTIVFSSNHAYFFYSVKNQKIEKLFDYTEKAENRDFYAEAKAAAYTIDNDLYIVGESFVKKVASSDNRGIVYGQEVHRREFGIEKGTFWSPEGNKLAFYRKDETMVADYPLVDIDTRIASVKNEKYPMAGEASHHVTVGIYNVANDDIIYLETGEPKEKYLTNITWSPDGKLVYIAVLNRDQNHMKLNAYDAETGKMTQTLFEEKHEKYVEPENGPVFLPWNDKHFLWLSRRDGYDHLYLYNTNGELEKQLTKGKYEVLEINGFDKKNESVFFTSTIKSPLERHLSVVNMRGKVQTITSREGTHNITLSDDGNYFVDVYSSLNTGSEYMLKSMDNTVLHTLVEKNSPLSANYQTGKTELLTIKAADGETDLYARMIKPYDFDPAQQYPVIIYVYGGPHAQLVQNTWLGGGNIFLNYLASQGYIVFTLDNRGSANRGMDFESAVFRNLGQLEVADQMKGVDYLKKQPYVDTARIGVDGWSYGGFMTIAMLLEHPDVFKAGVAGGPVIDWKYYEVMYGERYMDTPQSNPEGYEAAGILGKVDKLDSRLLVIHGTADPVVVWQHSLQFLKTAIQKRKLVDYFVYPGHEHNVGGIDRLHLYQKIEQYFKDHL